MDESAPSVKRPQGFDQPPPARRPRTAEPATPVVEPDRRRVRGNATASTPTATEPPPASLSAPSRSTSAIGFDPDAVSTEPIPVLAPTIAPTIATTTAPSTAPAGPSPVGPGSTSSPAAGPPSAGGPRAAKRALAAAARERRKYERQEVRRFTKRSRRRRIAWSIAVGSVLALVVVVVVGAYSPLMALREVRVEGAQRIAAADIEAAFAPSIGTPLPLITRAEVHRALTAFPLIETYSTETIPPGTLVVRIVERTPVGVIDTNDGLALVDAAGVVIDRPSERPEGQPLITAEGGVVGEGFRAAAAVIRSLPPEVRAQLVGVQAATVDDVRLELTSGATVVWGSAEQSAQKAAVLGRLMVAAPPDTVSAYDVSSPKSPVTK